MSEFGHGTPKMCDARSFPHWISIPPLIFKLDFLPFFGLYSQAETTSVTTKTRTKILGGVVFEKIFLQNLHDALIYIQSSGSIGGRPIGGTLPFLEKIISGSIGGTLKMTDCQIF